MPRTLIDVGIVWTCVVGLYSRRKVRSIKDIIYPESVYAVLLSFMGLPMEAVTVVYL